ncbi:hypothetical protein G3T36_08115 [Diaminobutyricibacter tongyongensis]|uniref:Uncharacterized protein n=1 Tax=Leifsonia tongyongensis TaxID=1268043 RepID=A0A6L9XX31_9MICO|nr:hypothetical protein [Diaminobutyricibacter tongyongensis]NEN05836.1 hypothetical protein [Diaminobutyricibacter tongyongensis]
MANGAAVKGVEIGFEPDDGEPRRVVFRFTGPRVAYEVTSFVSFSGGSADLGNPRPQVSPSDPPVTLELPRSTADIVHVGVMWTERLLIGRRFRAARIRLGEGHNPEEWRIVPVIGVFAPNAGRWV